MAPTNLLNVVSLALLALHAISFATPTSALSLQGDQMVRRHAQIAHRELKAPAKRATNSKRCKARSSSAAPSSTKPAAAEKATTSTKKPAAAATTKAPASTPTAASSSGSSSSSSSSSNSGGSGLRGKACLAWPNADYIPLKPWVGNNVGLIYTWDADKPKNVQGTGMTYAPMLWGWKNAEDFKEKTVEGYANIALGMNEPNEEGQSDMSADDGVSLWKQYMLPLADKGYTLISPAMSSRPNGKDWVKTFMEDCDNCQVSGIATHYYGTDLEEFKSYVKYWHDTYNLPVYVTEYADQDFNGGPQANIGDIWAFMEGATQYANENDWIHAHCWFGAMTGMSNVNPLNTLMNADGTPNALGQYFINN
jgi:hypothetical protein